MARVKLKAEVNWLQDMADDFGRMADDFPMFIEEATKAQLEVVEIAAKRNWNSMVPNSNDSGLVVDSIGQNVTRGRNGSDVVGSVGVFKIDSVFSNHGRERGDINAPQLAWWTEFGTYGSAGVPFLSNAFYSTINEQEGVFKQTIEQLIQRNM